MKEYMFSDDENIIAKNWEKYKNFTVRPLPSTVKFYKKCLEKYTNNTTKHFLYGGTPEIRSLAYDKNLSLLIADRSETMVRSMGKLTSHNTPLSTNEYLIISDWTNLNIANEQMDILIGDDAINMVSWDKFPKFLQNSRRILKKDGIFVCHLLVEPSKIYQNKSFSETMQLFHDKKIKSVYDLASFLNFIFYNKETYEMGWQETIKRLTNSEKNTLKSFFDFENIFKLCNSLFACPPIKDFENLLKNNFLIEDVYYPEEYEYCKFEPIYLLKKI